MSRKSNLPASWEGQTIRWSCEDQVARLVLHRHPCNEIGTTTLAELERFVGWLQGGASGALALVIESNIDRGFSAGADLRELHRELAATDGAPFQKTKIEWRARRFLRRIHAVFSALDRAPLLTVAAVQGVCFGGGFELALTSDVIVADKSARFCFPELRLGLVPGFGGVPRLERDVGNAVVRDLLLSGRSIGATRAHAIGLVSQLVSSGRAAEVARDVARQGARFDRRTQTQAKQFLKQRPSSLRFAQERETFVRLLMSPHVQAALDDFVHRTDVRPYLPRATQGDS